MKRWAIVTIVLYALLLLLLSVPLMMIFGLDHSGPNNSWRWSIGLNDALEAFRTWWFWITLGVFVLSQAAMLVVPVASAERRPKARRRLLVPIVTAAFLLANLFFASFFAILCAAMGDESWRVFEWPADLTAQTAGRLPLVNSLITNLGFTPNADFFAGINLIGLLLLFWMLWGLIFFHFAKADQAESLMQRSTRWLLQGSILELLIAVPSHLIVRNRNDCCAPFITFWGIVTGISVTLLAFGPGVYFLLVARMRKLRPKPTSHRPDDETPPAH